MLSVLALNAIWAFAVSVTAQTPAASGEPCAQIYSYWSQYNANDPSQSFFRLPPAAANACLQSVQLNREDTLNLLTGLSAWFQWQSTLAWLKDPPADYPFPAVDVLGELKRLADQVQDGTITREIDFQTQLVDLVSSARDGHFSYMPDAYSVFGYFNPLGSLISVSTDGTELPEVYLYNDLFESAAQGWVPSPVATINGTGVVDWLSQRAFNETLLSQDLDALYNSMFYSINAKTTGGNNQVGYFYEPLFGRFIGSSITLTFNNGSEITSPLAASSVANFSQVVDGDIFYQAFCNVTLKKLAAENSAPSGTGATGQTSTQDPKLNMPQYPPPVAISKDGALSGYFLDDEPDVAVLVILAMSEDEQPSSQATLTFFLNQCREANKTRLIIDVSQNGGGSVMLAYDFFKQLFPTVDPYLAQHFRAHPQVNNVGSFFTPLAQQAVEEHYGNLSLNRDSGAYTMFAAGTFSDDSGRVFESWDQIYGPVKVHGDQFTEQFTLRIEDSANDLYLGSIVVSGYGANTEIAPQPFLSENIIIFGDGFCASSCTIFSHLMKYQGKVKSIVAGGRPQPGPAQQMGGVKGSRVADLAFIRGNVENFYDQASQKEIDQAEKTLLKDFLEQADVLQYRQAPNQGSAVNIFNAFSQYDDSSMPLHFVYEAADCRIWYQPSHFFNITLLWQTVAEQAFGVNGVEPYSLCVAGSTNHPSSLSGNAELFDGGKIVNVTGYSLAGNETVPEGNGEGGNDSNNTNTNPPGGGDNGTNSSASENGSASIAASVAWVSMVSATALGFMMLLFM